MLSSDMDLGGGIGRPAPPPGLTPRLSFSSGDSVDAGLGERLERADLGRNLTAGVVDALGIAIASGNFDDAPFPTEAVLARHFSVSHSVIREATKMLAAKGLLAARPRQGTIVRPQHGWSLFDADVLRWILKKRLSTDLLRQLIELRLAIEPAAAALAARSRSAAGLTMIERAYQGLAAAHARGENILEFRKTFHAALLAASENPFYARFRDLVHAVIEAESHSQFGANALALDPEPYRLIRRSIADGDEKVASDEVKKIISRIAVSGDSETAKAWLAPA